MNKIDLLLAAERDQSRAVLNEFKRIFGSRRKGKKDAALGFELANQPPALTRHKRTRARAHKSFGNINCRALRPSRRHMGDQLENGLALQRLDLVLSFADNRRHNAFKP